MFLNAMKDSNMLVSHLQRVSSMVAGDDVSKNSMFFSSTPIYDDGVLMTIMPFSSLNINTSSSQSRSIRRAITSNSPQSYSTSPSSSIISTNDTCCSTSINGSGGSAHDSLNGYIQYRQQMKKIPKKDLPTRSAAIDMRDVIENARQLKLTNKKQLYCTFCKNNGEHEDIFTSHLLKDSLGKVLCPILKLHVCPICGESGEKAHTITYCKEYKKSQRFQMLQNALDKICNE